ncbi:MAG: NapC/NirT family cytochrome c [bacterium]
MSEQGTKARVSNLLKNWISIVGILLGMMAFILGTALLVIDILNEHSNPYLGLVVYGIIPMMICGSLLLTAIGMVRTFQHRREAGADVPLLKWDPRDGLPLKKLFVAALLLGIFAVVSLVASYQMYHFTESVEFCGKTCHKVMSPEYTTFQNSPHSRMLCTSCHIGPGAEWYVRAKVSGLYQVYSVIANKYHRPIESPVVNLRPAKETCLACHWPQKFFGAVMKSWTTYLPDEKNSPWTIKMLLNIGGGDPAHGAIHGIHWHMEGINTVEYIASDRKRSVIPWIRVTDQHGKITTYQTKNEKERLSPEQVTTLQARRMDCLDCHNRPSHRLLSPYQALDMAMSDGKIDKSMPGIKKTAAKLLATKYDTSAQADTAITAGLKEKYPQHPKLDETIKEVQAIYGRNFFPEMKARWDEYPNLTGHKITAGCFRCHDGQHFNESGIAIRKDCNLCHTILAQGSGTDIDLKGLMVNGMEFKHPEDIEDAWKTDRCDSCHTGAP